MEIKSMQSNLKMSSLFFSECSIKRNQAVADGEMKADLQRDIKEVGEHTYDVELTLTIEKEDLNVLVVAHARFTYEAENYEKEEAIVSKNTVAIMFPFIRSQVSLLTTQPGMMPIVLPPINTAKLK